MATSEFEPGDYVTVQRDGASRVACVLSRAKTQDSMFPYRISLLPMPGEPSSHHMPIRVRRDVELQPYHSPGR